MKEKECGKEEKSRANRLPLVGRQRLFGGDLLGFLADNNLPAMNFKESRRAYKLEISAPGFEKEDFSVQIDGNMLTIKGNDRKETVEQDEAEITLRQEFIDTSFSRSFNLPKDADPDRAEAKAKNGMLTVKIYKKENEPEPVRFIPIE